MLIAAALTLAAMVAPVLPARAQESVTAWPFSGQNIHNTRHAAGEHQVGPSNVAHLAPRWVVRTDGSVTTTPAVVDGIVYFPDYGGALWAVEATSGKVIWKHEFSEYSGIPGDISRATPAYWKGLLITGEGVQTTRTGNGALMLGIDADTGQLRWRTKVSANPSAMITSSPIVDHGTVYIGVSSKDETLATPPTFRGSVVALEARTGRILWKTYMVPPGYTGGSVWGSTPVVDHATGLLYVTTGNNYSAPAGMCTIPTGTDCTPVPPDDRINSIVALDLKTGKVVWSTSTGVGDVSTNYTKRGGPDWDFAQGPTLFTTTRDGKSVSLLGAGQKSGIYWALDPETGKVVWKTQVGPGGGLGGMLWGSATDGKRIYVAITNADRISVTLTSATGTVSKTIGGYWAAIDAATGQILWQTADPQRARDTGALSIANGVVYAGSMARSGDNMYALDAATGEIKWRFASGGAVSSGAAIVDGTVYWGCGYHTRVEAGLGSKRMADKLYAFALVGK